MTAAVRLHRPSNSASNISGTANFNNTTINSASIKVAWAINFPEALTVTALGFRYGVRAATPVQHKISLQGLSATGDPDGTILGGGTPASGLFTPPADTTWNSTWQWVTLDNSYPTTRGEFAAIVIEPVGTPDGTNNSSFTRNTDVLGVSGRVIFPYSMAYGGASWSRDNSNLPSYGYKTASSVYGNPVQGQISRATTTAGHRVANKFVLPSGHGDTFQVAGVILGMDSLATGTTFKVGLWDASSTLQEITVDGDFTGIASNSLRRIQVYFDEVTLSTLSFGTTYYFGVEQVSTTVLTGRGFQVASSGDMAALPDGTNFHAATYNGSAWTDVATERLYGEIILADITEPAGGGGGGIVIGGNLVL